MGSFPSLRGWSPVLDWCRGGAYPPRMISSRTKATARNTCSVIPVNRADEDGLGCVRFRVVPGVALGKHLAPKARCLIDICEAKGSA